MFDAMSNNARYSGKHAQQFLQHCETYFKWKQCEEMLEIGCADGRNAKNILYPFVEKHLKHLEAVDIDDNAIHVANSGNDKPHLKFSVMDIENQQLVSVRKDKYAHIFSFYLLHLVSPKIWPKNLFCMTKPGGQVFASIFLSPSILTKTIKSQITENNKPWSRYFEDYKDVLHSYYGSDPRKVSTEYLTDAGFLVDVVDLLTVQADLDSKEALQRTLMSANIIGNTLPTDMHGEYVNDFGEKMMEYAKLNNATGAVAIDMDVVIFVASKP